MRPDAICCAMQCDSFRILHEDSWAGRVNGFFVAMWNAIFEILERSYVSLAGVVTLLMVSFFFVPTKLSRRRRALLGFLHAAAHITSAVLLMLLMELAIEICIRNHLLATSGWFIFFFSRASHLMKHAISSARTLVTLHPKYKMIA